MFCKRSLSLLCTLIASCSSSLAFLHTLKSLMVIPQPIHQPSSFNLHILTQGDLLKVSPFDKLYLMYLRTLGFYPTNKPLSVGYETFISEPLISCSCWIDLGESRAHYRENSSSAFHYWNQQLPNVSGTGNT